MDRGHLAGSSGLGLRSTGGLRPGERLLSLVLIIVGSLYVLFATMAGNGSEIFVEAIIGAVFVALAVIGFRTSLWFVVAGLALHGIFDFVRGGILPGTGVPGFWPAFCGSYDVVAAAILAALLLLDQKRIARA